MGQTLRELQIYMTTDLSILSNLNKRAAALANRWVKTLNRGDTFAIHSAGNVTIDTDKGLICFTAHCSDGVSFRGRDSISIRYLDNDSTLEWDAREWKAEEDKRQTAVRARIEELKERPEVQEYLSLATHESQRWAYPQGYGWGGMPMYPLHPLLKETPKP